MFYHPKKYRRVDSVMGRIMYMLIRNANAFIDGRFISETDVLVREGRISRIGKNLAADDAQVVDLHGDYLLPGFVDVHMHGYGGWEIMNGEDELRAICREARKKGLAAFLATTETSTAMRTAASIRAIHNVMLHPEEDGAIVLGAHMEGPFMAAEKSGALLKEYFVLPTIENFERYTEGAADAVKMISMAPELEGAVDFIRYAVSRGIHVSIGHTGADAETVHAAADCGADHVTHMFNAQTGLHHRRPGVPGAAMADDRLFCEVICDGVHVHPDVVRVAARCKGAERFVAITDAMTVTGLPEGEYFACGHKVIVRSDAVYLEDGTLCGSKITMADAFVNLIRCGIAPEDAALMTTQTPARSVGAENIGVIREGACAVFARFNQDFEFVEAI